MSACWVDAGLLSWKKAEKEGMEGGMEGMEGEGCRLLGGVAKSVAGRMHCDAL